MLIVNSAYWKRWQSRLSSIVREMEKQGNGTSAMDITQASEVLEIAQLTKALQAAYQALRSCQIVLEKRGESEGV